MILLTHFEVPLCKMDWMSGHYSLWSAVLRTKKGSWKSTEFGLWFCHASHRMKLFSVMQITEWSFFCSAHRMKQFLSYIHTVKLFL